MAYLFGNCDDVHDAAAQAIEALNARLTRRGVELTAESRASLREVIAGALGQAEVEGLF